MSWRDQLRAAMLGKAAFLVDSTDGQLGRNTQLHEYPLRDTPYVEDLGRKARRFTLEAYVIGADYMTARDALIAELETAGSKTLIHPYLGELKVTVVDCNGPHESTREGGKASFNITVIESGEHIFLSTDSNTADKITQATDVASDDLQTTFVKHFDVTSAPTFVESAAVTNLRDFASKLTELTRYATTVPDAVSDYVSAITELSDAASQLILVPQTLFSKITAIFSQLSTVIAEPGAALDIVRSLFDYGQDFAVVPTGTISRQQESDNQAAFVELIQVSAICTAAQLVAIIDYASADDALAARDEMILALDDQSERITDDDLYYALVDVRIAVVADLEVRAAQLARLQQITLGESTPAIVLAHSLYADALRDADIIGRNRVRDPNFLSSGQALQVLSNE